MLFIILSFLLFNINLLAETEYIDEIIVEEELENNNIKKDIKNTKNQSSSTSLEEKSNLFVRKNGGLGKTISFYLEGSTASQINTNIEGFEYNIPSLTSFYPVALHFGNFDIITLDKDLSSSNRSSHSANLDFKISNKNYISFMLGSFSSLAFSINQNFIFKNDSKLNIGLSSLASKGDFEYIDIAGKDRTRNNNNFAGLDFHLKYTSDYYKILNYTTLKYNGEPGSNQFEHLNSNSISLENLTGVLYNKSINIFDLEFKFSNNFKKYNYNDNAYWGHNTVNFHFLFDTISLDNSIVFPVYEYFIFKLKINNMIYFGKSYEENKKNGVDFISKYYPSIFLFLDQFYFDDRLNISIKGKYFLRENLLQYSLNSSYKIDDKFTISFLYKKGARIPYIEELYYNSIFIKGNPNLKAETYKGGDLSFDIKLNNIQFSFNLYYKKIKNNIMFLPISFFMYRAKNIPNAISRGLNVNLLLNFKYIELINILNINDSYFQNTQRDLPQTPKYQNKLSIKLKYKKFSITNTYKYTSIYYNNIFNTDMIPSKHLFDLNLEYKNEKYKINFNIENLTNNKKLYDSRHIPLKGRSFFIYLFFNT